jgi:DNA repair photolyase
MARSGNCADLVLKNLEVGETDHMAREIKFGNRMVGDGHPTYVIAEIGINHNGDLEIAKQIIDAAVHAGVDAVKFQKRTPELQRHLNNKSQMRETPWGYISYLEYRYKVEFTRSNITRSMSFAGKETFPGWFQCGMNPQWTSWKTLIRPRTKFHRLRSRIINCSSMSARPASR